MSIKRTLGRLLPDALFLRVQFYRTMGKVLSLKNPKTFNEKLQWLKLYDRRPEYTTIVDKYLVREYIANKIGEEHLIPLLGVWENPEEIDFKQLPNSFALKCNHNSGTGLVICTNKQKLDVSRTLEELRKGLQQDYYLLGREWPYKNVPRKIIAEKYITDHENTQELTDYKFFCFDGRVDSVMVAYERHTGDTKFYFFNQEWELLRLNVRGKEAPDTLTFPKPKRINEMVEVARVLSIGFPFVRVDLYESKGQVYFGELTLYPKSGFDKNLLPETDLYWGNLINLSEVRK